MTVESPSTAFINSILQSPADISSAPVMTPWWSAVLVKTPVVERFAAADLQAMGPAPVTPVVRSDAGAISPRAAVFEHCSSVFEPNSPVFRPGSPAMSDSAPVLLGYPHWSFSTPVSTQYAPATDNNAAAEVHPAVEALPGNVAPASPASAAAIQDTTPAMTVASSDLGSVYTPSTPDRARSLPLRGLSDNDCARNEREEVRLFNAAVKVMDREALKMVLRACIKDARPQKKKARALYEVSAPAIG